MLDASIRGNGKLPIGKWSDSRAMAWMAAHYGIGMLEFIDEKAVVFGPTELELFGTGTWGKASEGIWVSNKAWEHERVAGFDRAPYYGNVPRHVADKSKADLKADTDKEGHPRPHSNGASSLVQGDGDSRTVGGSGRQNTALTRQGSSGGSPNRHGQRGDPTGAHPFDSYMTAVRLWRSGDISHKSFKRERRKYEEWCREKKTQALPRPSKTGDLMIM